MREIDGYEPVWLPLYLDVADDGGSDLFVPRALTYIASPKNPRFLGFLPHEQIAIHIAKCAGMSGPNLDYILNLNNALHTAGLPDPHLTSIAEIVRAKQARDASTNVGENDACSE